MLNKLIKQKYRQDWFLGHILAFAFFARGTQTKDELYEEEHSF